MPQRSGQSSIGKLTVNVSKPAPIHGEHQSPAQWPHTRIFPGQTKLVLQPRPSTQTYNQEPNNIQQTYAKPTFSRSPKPTNDKRPTNQKEWLSAKYTWNALAQVRDYNVKVAFRSFPLVFVFSWKFLPPIQLKLCKTQTGCRYRAL